MKWSVFRQATPGSNYKNVSIAVFYLAGLISDFWEPNLFPEISWAEERKQPEKESLIAFLT